MLVLGLRTSWLFYAAVRDEREAGYTTIPYGRRNDIWVLEDKNGRVIYAPRFPGLGEAALGSDTGAGGTLNVDLPPAERNAALLHRLDELYSTGGISPSEYESARQALIERDGARR